ncbi:hypothetical protein AVEN_7019-1 [Araneus ventricosus]|uniref:Uncharacterized protein n=1 Tax=Araneus ventricosus TaxID=182803 RepID=A0A4Y2IDK5_ARAVE|nr:hypothetical protein AVEN_7019-1 [Araneus ventricosus]
MRSSNGPRRKGGVGQVGVDVDDNLGQREARLNLSPGLERTWDIESAAGFTSPDKKRRDPGHSIHGRQYQGRKNGRRGDYCGRES